MTESNKTIIVGSPEHRASQRKRIEDQILKACTIIGSDSTFSEKQRTSLRMAFVEIGKAIDSAIL